MISVWVVACQKKFSYKRACFSAVVNIYIKKNYAEGDFVPVYTVIVVSMDALNFDNLTIQLDVWRAVHIHLPCE